MTPIQFAPRRALHAAQALAANPDDLPKVFTIIEALSLGTVGRLGRRMAASETGRDLLERRPDIVDQLADRAALAQLPEGSLGRAYLAFVEREHISAEGIRAASEAEARSMSELPPPFDYVSERLRDTHDLWHAATGFHGDLVGETALLAFTLGQIWNPAVALIIGIALFKLAKVPALRPLVVEWFQHGRRAAWLPEQRWEDLLALPLDEVRARLRLPPPARYTPVRTSEIYAAA